ncbi:hypothetical protein IOLA_285 [uncultured bacterium]|nr:hypothetical protein IOLA_285 [uncultured bacterium]
MKIESSILAKLNIENTISKSVFSEKIYNIINNIILDNINKNLNLQREETIYSTLNFDGYSLDIYNTNLALINIENFYINIIYDIKEEYLNQYRLVSFNFNELEIVLTIFNKLIIFVDKKPKFCIIDEDEVKNILFKVFYSREIINHLSSIEGEVIYDIDVLPDILVFNYNKNNGEDLIKIIPN